jgi:hypothetical protein
MNKSSKISIERLSWILEQNQEWIKNCDTKTTTILALIGAIFTVLFASDSFAKIIQIWTIFFYSDYLCFARFYLLCTLVSWIIFAMGIYSFWRVLYAQLSNTKYQCPSEYKSNLYFGDIVSFEIDSYRSTIKSLGEEELRDDLSMQVYICAAICNQKFMYYTDGMKYMGLGVILILILLGFGYLSI